MERIKVELFLERAAEQVIRADASIACFSWCFLASSLECLRSARLNSSVGLLSVIISMKHTLILLLFAVLLFSCAHTAQVTPASQRGSVATREWKAFYPRFRAAVKKRDREALKLMMTPEFLYSFGGNLDRDEALEHWNKVEPESWNAFAKILAQGTVRYDKADAGGATILGRVAPPAAKGKRHVAWRAYFEFGKDNRWRCTGFVQGD